MLRRILLLVVGIHLSIGNRTIIPRPQSAVEKCMRERMEPNATRLQTLEALVGIGWDNLINIATTAVYAVTFDECRTTPDGTYLLPDNVIALPVQQTHFDQMAQAYDTYEEYRKGQSYSINIEAHAGVSGVSGWSGSVSGSYSTTNSDAKHAMYEHQSTLLVSKMKHHAYTLHAEPGGALSPGFEFRLREVADALTANRTTNARYLAELIIRDYGTHVISSADVGATIEREQHINSDVKAKDSATFNQYKAAVSANVGYAGVFNAGAKTSWSKTVSEETASKLSTETRHVVVRTKGGPKPAATTKDDQEVFVLDNLVSFDVRGDFLFTSIHNSKLRVHPQFENVIDLLQNATKAYYGHNEVRGCMEPDAKNYNYNANVNDSSCVAEDGEFFFGGLFVACAVVPGKYFTPPDYQCEGYNVPNVLTGETRCEEDFERRFIVSSIITLERRERHYYYDNGFDEFFGIVTIDDVIYFDDIEVAAYWCAQKSRVIQPTPNQRVLFAGIFNDGSRNQITNDAGCPGHFQTFSVFQTTKFCLSRDYQRDSQYAVQLQNIFSCNSPSEDQKCAPGFSQHLAFVHESCEVYYCVRNEVFLKVDARPVQRPPFTVPQSFSNLAVSSVTVYVNERLDTVVPLEQVLMKGKKLMHDAGSTLLKGKPTSDQINKAALEHWMRDYHETKTKQFKAMQQKQKEAADESGGGSSPWYFVLTSIGGFVLGAAAVVAVLATIAWRKRRTAEIFNN